MSNIVETLRSLLPEGGAYPLHEPYFDEEEVANVTDCVRSGWVSSVGSYVDQFERNLAAFTGVKHAIATVNGTAALHISYALAGVEPGDEVLCPSLSFVATANAIAYCGATPHFVDVDPQRLTLCPKALRMHLEANCRIENQRCINAHTDAPIRALVVMHCFGHPADLGALKELCDQFHLTLIEDAAESLGSYYKGTHTGNHGSLAALSFNGNKILTTGGGGAILTNDEALAKRAKHLTTTAKQPHPYAYLHDEVGYNYRLPNLNAALGVAQLKKLPGFLQQKRELATRYAAAFANHPDASFFAEPSDSQSNYWLNTLLLKAPDTLHDTLKVLHEQQIYARPIWNPLHTLPMFEACPRANLRHTESLAQRLINIPSSPKLTSLTE